MTTKVKQTETYKDSQGEHIVVKGKLVLIEIKPKRGYYSSWFSRDGKQISAIIISETEDIKVGDNYLNEAGYIHTFKEHDVFEVLKNNKGKILTLPEYFSPKHLQAIIDGKLKDEDEVYVECFHNIIMDEIQIKCNVHTNNHIKLFPIKKEESWDDIKEQYDNYTLDLMGTPNILTFEYWLIANYNPPTKK